MSPIPCPACSRFLPESPTSCPGCHLPLTGPDAARLWPVAQSLAALQVERPSRIAALEGVSEVYSVAGDADLIAMIRVQEHEQLNDVIADRLNKVQGVIGTNTHIAFRTYSKHDLDAAFSLGIDDAD